MMCPYLSAILPSHPVPTCAKDNSSRSASGTNRLGIGPSPSEWYAHVHKPTFIPVFTSCGPFFPDGLISPVSVLLPALIVHGDDVMIYDDTHDGEIVKFLLMTDDG